MAAGRIFQATILQLFMVDTVVVHPAFQLEDLTNPQWSEVEFPLKTKMYGAAENMSHLTDNKTEVTETILASHFLSSV